MGRIANEGAELLLLLRLLQLLQIIDDQNIPISICFRYDEIGGVGRAVERAVVFQIGLHGGGLAKTAGGKEKYGAALGQRGIHLLLKCFL